MEVRFMSGSRTRVSALLLTSLLWVAGCGEDSGLVDEIGVGESVAGSVVLRFGATPDTDPGEEGRFWALAAALEERLNVAAEYVPAADADAALQSFRDADVHFAWFDGLTGVRARSAVPGSQAIAQGVEDTQSYSYLIANRKLDLKPSEAFPMGSRGLRVSLGAHGSTSGQLMPEASIRQATGEAPGDFYSEVAFSDSGSRTLELVNEGRFDLGIVNRVVYDAAGPEAKANTVALWQTPRYADYQITIRPDLDEEFRGGFSEDLQEVLLALPTDVCQQVFSRSKLVAASNDDFDELEDQARSAGLLR